VDLWGNTALDNAIRKEDTAAMAVLKRAGGLTSSHPDVQAKHVKVVEEIKAQKAKADREQVSQALSSVPEEWVAKQLAAVVSAFQKFVQVHLSWITLGNHLASCYASCSSHHFDSHHLEVRIQVPN
jgi:hypothetical protein